MIEQSEAEQYAPKKRSSDYKIRPIPHSNDIDVESFWLKVDKSDGCWKWKGKYAGDYGIFYIKQLRYRAHRVSYSLAKGPIGEGLYIDHMCRNPGCVNPEHLRAVTPRINSIENSDGPPAINANKIACVRGHLLTPDNIVERDSDKRNCKFCSMAAQNARFQWDKTTFTRNQEDPKAMFIEGYIMGKYRGINEVQRSKAVMAMRDALALLATDPEIPDHASIVIKRALAAFDKAVEVRK